MASRSDRSRTGEFGKFGFPIGNHRGTGNPIHGSTWPLWTGRVRSGSNQRLNRERATPPTFPMRRQSCGACVRTIDGKEPDQIHELVNPDRDHDHDHRDQHYQHTHAGGDSTLSTCSIVNVPAKGVNALVALRKTQVTSKQIKSNRTQR